MFFEVVIFLIVGLYFHVKRNVLELVVDVLLNERITCFNGGSKNCSDTVLLENGGILGTVDVA